MLEVRHNEIALRTQWTFPALKGLCDIKLSMLEVRETEVALRKLSGGTAQLRTL